MSKYDVVTSVTMASCGPFHLAIEPMLSRIGIVCKPAFTHDLAPFNALALHPFSHGNHSLSLGHCKESHPGTVCRCFVRLDSLATSPRVHSPPRLIFEFAEPFLPAEELLHQAMLELLLGRNQLLQPLNCSIPAVKHFRNLGLLDSRRKRDGYLTDEVGIQIRLTDSRR